MTTWGGPHVTNCLDIFEEDTSSSLSALQDVSLLDKANAMLSNKHAEAQ